MIYFRCYQKMRFQRYTSVLEEILNSTIHGLGIVLAILGSIMLILHSLQYDTWRVLGISIFGIAIILTYTFSTLYHSLYFTKANKVFKVLDHSSIFLLISGTYSGFILAVLRNNLGFIMLSIVWLITIMGIIYKSIFIGRFKILQAVTYTFLGWVAIFIIKPLLTILSLKVIILLLIGGLFYTLGLIFFAWTKLKFNHTIWHIFVLIGSICHFFALYNL